MLVVIHTSCIKYTQYTVLQLYVACMEATQCSGYLVEILVLQFREVFCKQRQDEDHGAHERRITEDDLRGRQKTKATGLNKPD